MEYRSTFRRHLTFWLVTCFLAQGSIPATAGSLAHSQLLTQRITSWSVTRSLQTAPAPNHFASVQADLPEVSFDFSPQWTISLLAKVRTSYPGLLPADTARFGRAPPSSVLELN